MHMPGPRSNEYRFNTMLARSATDSVNMELKSMLFVEMALLIDIAGSVIMA